MILKWGFEPKELKQIYKCMDAVITLERLGMINLDFDAFDGMDINVIKALHMALKEILKNEHY